MGDAIPTGPTTVIDEAPETPEVDVQAEDSGAQGESGSGDSESWVPADASDEMKELVEKHNYKSADDMAKALHSLESKIGSAVQIPGKDASDEEIDAFFKRLGRPESAQGYDLPEPELPDGYGQDKEFSDAFRKMAYDSGLSSYQARALWDWYNSRTVSMFTQKRQNDIKSIASALDALRENWGENFDNELALTKNLVAKEGDDELRKLFNVTGIGNNPAMIRFVNKMAHKLGEDRLDGSGGKPQGQVENRPGVLNYDSMPNPTRKP
jgi:hypothetical protein